MVTILLANQLMLLTALVFSSVASYFDLKTGEIPDKFSVGLVIVGISFRALFSFLIGDFMFLFDGIAVGGIFFLFGALLFYTGGWGGGDAKLIAGIGACLGGLLAPSLIDTSLFLLPAFFGFFIALAIAAIPYSLTYALILAIRRPIVFRKTVSRMKKDWIILVFFACLSAVLLIIVPSAPSLMYLVLLLPAPLYVLMLFTRSVERYAMQKDVSVDALVVGDMVAEDLYLGEEKIASKRDMDGLSEEVLEKIRSSNASPRKVRIKWGIRFAPAFPIAIAIAPVWTQLFPLL